MILNTGNLQYRLHINIIIYHLNSWTWWTWIDIIEIRVLWLGCALFWYASHGVKLCDCMCVCLFMINYLKVTFEPHSKEREKKWIASIWLFCVFFFFYFIAHIHLHMLYCFYGLVPHRWNFNWIETKRVHAQQFRMRKCCKIDYASELMHTQLWAVSSVVIFFPSASPQLHVWFHVVWFSIV